jgi:hypothetical protein
MSSRKSSSIILYQKNSFSENIQTPAENPTIMNEIDHDTIKIESTIDSINSNDGINHNIDSKSTENLLDISNNTDKKGYQNFFVVLLLLSINLLNYCDRYTLASKTNLLGLLRFVQ